MYNINVNIFRKKEQDLILTISRESHCSVMKLSKDVHPMFDQKVLALLAQYNIRYGIKLIVR